MPILLNDIPEGISIQEENNEVHGPASLPLVHPRHGRPNTLSPLLTLNHDGLGEIMEYLPQSDQSDLACTCHTLHTATLPHRCAAPIRLFPADRIISSFHAFLRLDTPTGIRAPLINKLYIAIPTTIPGMADWQTPTPGYRATFPWITDTVLDILVHCTNLGTLSIDSWSARLPADWLCSTIAALRALEDLQLIVTHDRLWAETPALALHLAVDRDYPAVSVPIDPVPLPLVASFSPPTLTELRLLYDRRERMDACLPNVRKLHLTLARQKAPDSEGVLPTLAHALPNLVSLTYGVRRWLGLGLDERTATPWRDANRAWAAGEGRAAWPQLAVLGGLDVRDLWMLGLAHRVPHVCVAGMDPLLEKEARAAAWARRMLPAVLEDTRATHLELAATWQSQVYNGHVGQDVNSVETLSALRECGGAPGASVTHLILNVPVPEVLQDRLMPELCGVLPNLLCTHLCVRVLRQAVEEARGTAYCASLPSSVKQQLKDYASSVAQASSTLCWVAFCLESVGLLAWGISRPDGVGRPQLEEMSEQGAWAVVTQEKLYAHQNEFSRSEKDIPALA
ncbi:hypothetical protein C8T65DRAFT_743814 [Cerioporus squamosus]|nr:hypothetical protein C8T65DRAFT_743814 [Cerioporus squamosus]